MPELGEVAHAASLLRRFLLGRTIKSVSAQVDEIVFVKPLSNSTLESRLAGQKVTQVGRNGKYFWFECNGNLTVLLHFGMTGWINVKDIKTHFIVMESGGDKKAKEQLKTNSDSQGSKQIIVEEAKSEVWPPKFTKFILTTDEGRELAFSDPRRLGRVRLFDASNDEVQKLEPLSKLGTDFSQNELDVDTVSQLIAKRKVPIKALLLDQAVFSGIGNWMADEILYQARIHPEQYSNTLDQQQLALVYEKLVSISKYTAETEGNSAAFPKDWLMLYRWGKGRKKDEQTTHDGRKVAHITVGGRTSCYVPELQQLLTGSTTSTIKTEVKTEVVEQTKTKTVRKTKTKTKTVVAEQAADLADSGGDPAEIKEETHPEGLSGPRAKRTRGQPQNDRQEALAVPRKRTRKASTGKSA